MFYKYSINKEKLISGLEVIKLFSCSSQLSMFIMLINVKMSSTVGILTFISIMNTISKSLRAILSSAFQFTLEVEIACSVHLVMKKI